VSIQGSFASTLSDVDNRSRHHLGDPTPPPVSPLPTPPALLVYRCAPLARSRAILAQCTIETGRAGQPGFQSATVPLCAARCASSTKAIFARYRSSGAS
jgi:hypothetical protein